jgi:hypothetical protein
VRAPRRAADKLRFAQLRLLEHVMRQFLIKMLSDQYSLNRFLEILLELENSSYNLYYITKNNPGIQIFGVKNEISFKFNPNKNDYLSFQMAYLISLRKLLQENEPTYVLKIINLIKKYNSENNYLTTYEQEELENIKDFILNLKTSKIICKTISFWRGESAIFYLKQIFNGLFFHSDKKKREWIDYRREVVGVNGADFDAANLFQIIKEMHRKIVKIRPFISKTLNL